ncbi:MAG: UPF0104 family protein [Proteobacteria bacterium]|nr:UPF0104 family protein [Pseudomonadota bacterium]
MIRNKVKLTMKLPNQKLKTLIKTVLGLALVVWVLRDKMIDFDLLKHLIFSPLNLAVAFVFLATSSLLCTSRWLILVKAQGLYLNFRDLFSLTMIGNFFNTFMPGSVGGDLMKAWYIAGKEPNKRIKAVFTVILDRVLGLSVIIAYAAFTLLIFSNWLQGKPQLQILAVTIWTFSFMFILFSALFFYAPIWKSNIFNRINRKLRSSARLGKLLDAAFIYQNHPKQLLAALFLSALSILSANYFHFLEGSLLGIRLSLVQYFVIVPISVTAAAVPLLPGGIGTGQVAFYTLYAISEGLIFFVTMRFF